MTRITALLSLMILLLFSCKKSDHYAQLVDNQPFLITGEMGLNNVGLGVYPGYQTSYLVGDTAMLVGKFFPDRPGSKIQVGSDTAHILFHASIASGTNEYTHQPDQLDVVKFLITRSMGLGDNIPVSIYANGVTIEAPAISIRQFLGIKRQTDTTLYVDSVANWKPADMSFYQQNYISMVINSSVSGDGAICFSNLTGIYALQNRQVSRWLAVGDSLQENGTAFMVNVILGSVLSFAGDTLTFSAEVKENTPDTATAYIFRICKMNLASHTVTTINRTEVQKGIAAANETPILYEGALNTLHMVATDLKTDANGSIYFINNYPPASTSYNTNTWYGGMYGGGISQVSSFVGDANVLGNVCRASSSGVVKSLFSNHSPYNTPIYTVPGYPSGQLSDYLISLDGSTGYACDQMGMFRPSLGYFDLQQDALLIATGLNPAPYRFFSYDTSMITGRHKATWSFPILLTDDGNLNDYLILPDGDLLVRGTASLAAANLQNKTVYCYAGTEAGLGSAPPVQNKTTGPAKYVQFLNIFSLFAGEDKLDNVYYYTGFKDYTNGLNFYKLYSKQ